MVIQKSIEVSTNGHGHMLELTGRVSKLVKESGVTTGIVNVFNVGSTGAVGTIEFEPGLCEDLPHILDKLMPASRDYQHEKAWNDGNAHSHLQATTLGPSLSIPIKDSLPMLGTWQQIFLYEGDVRPRNRTIIVTIYGE